MGKFALEMDMVDPSKASTIRKKFDYTDISVNISVDVKDSTDPLTLQLMADAGGDVLKTKRAAVTKSLLSAGDWLTMMQKRNPEGLEDELAERERSLNQEIERHLREGERQAREKMNKALEKAKRDKKEATKIKAKYAGKSTVQGLKVAKSITGVVVSGGTNVAAWVGLAKNIYSLAKQIHQYCKDLETLWEELRQAIEKVSIARTQLKAARETLESASDASTKQKLKSAYKVAKAAFKDPQQKALTACTNYEEKVTLVAANAHSLAKKLDKLLKKDKTGLNPDKISKVERAIDSLINETIELREKAADGKKLAKVAQQHLAEVKEELQDLQTIIRGLQAVQKGFKYGKKIASAAEKLLDIVG